MKEDLAYVPHPENPLWQIPKGLEKILGREFVYHLGPVALALHSVQLNRHIVAEHHTRVHQHDHYQIIFYIEGKGVQFVGNRKIPVEDGRVFFINQHTPHAFQGGNSGTTKCFSTTFELLPESFHRKNLHPSSGNELQQFLKLFANRRAPYLQLDPLENADLKSSLNLLVHEIQKQDIGYLIFVEAELLRIFARFLRSAERSGEFQSGVNSTEVRRQILVRRVRMMLEENYANPPEIREIARECGVNINHLNKIFSQAYGTTMNQYLLKYRVDRARKLLLQGDGNITEVAFQTGFNDSNYFARIFRKITGKPPGHFLKVGKKITR